MNDTIRQLEPKRLWNHFADINAVPRASKKEERIIAFMQDFGKKLGLETLTDAVGNVIIKKTATPGMENRKTVVLQSHLDMVHQKNNDTQFDFDTQGIEMYVDGDWVRAKGTTLGADNGLGVATIMAILESTDIPHPAIEALFTIDEETGMTGAMGLEGGLLQGQILLNLDTEEDDEIGIGCAGGIDITAHKNYNPTTPPNGSTGYEVIVAGLQGGHSGMDIHKGLGNANKLMNRLLYALIAIPQTYIARIDGGGLRNAIPRESRATLSTTDPGKLQEAFQTTQLAIVAEYRHLEPNINITLRPTEVPQQVLSQAEQTTLVNALYAVPNGVYRMTPTIPDLVETSNNLARVLVENGKILVACLTRSSVESSKADMANMLKASFELGGCTVEFSGGYPGWAPNMESQILQVLDKLYQELNNGQKANIAACHAGLECGIIGRNYPGMDMISFGPTIKGAHSPDERANISSTQKYWKFVLEILKNIPEK